MLTKILEENTVSVSSLYNLFTCERNNILKIESTDSKLISFSVKTCFRNEIKILVLLAFSRFELFCFASKLKYFILVIHNNLPEYEIPSDATNRKLYQPKTQAYQIASTKLNRR